MVDFLRKGLRYAIRKLEYIHETGFDYRKVTQARQLGKMGVHYSRFSVYNKKWLLNSNIRTVIDIGASVGEFTAIYAELFPDAQIYAFEPLPDCFEELKLIANNYERIEPYNIALGNKEGRLKFHRSSWVPASSFREMTDLHKKNYPHSAGSETVEVDVKTLDKVFENVHLDENILIKMDVQGFEDEVIKGGIETIKKAKVLVIECSLQTTYIGEPMFHGVYSLMHPLGFEYRGSIKQSVRKDDESFLQADCVFIRKVNSNI